MDRHSSRPRRYVVVLRRTAVPVTHRCAVYLRTLPTGVLVPSRLTILIIARFIDQPFTGDIYGEIASKKPRFLEQSATRRCRTGKSNDAVRACRLVAVHHLPTRVLASLFHVENIHFFGLRKLVCVVAPFLFLCSLTTPGLTALVSC